MQRLLSLIILTLIFWLPVSAVDIVVVDNVTSNDRMFMDMAISAANKSAADKGPLSGAVIILDGMWRSTGVPTAELTAEEVAYKRSRLQSLDNAVVFTLNEPTSAVVNMLNGLNVGAIYFVNGRNDVVAAGIYPASAYDDTIIDLSAGTPNLIRLVIPEAKNHLNTETK